MNLCYDIYRSKDLLNLCKRKALVNFGNRASLIKIFIILIDFNIQVVN